MKTANTKGTSEVKVHVQGMLSTAEEKTLKTAVTTGYDTAIKAAKIYEDSIRAILSAHIKDSNIKTPEDVKKMILASTRRLLEIKNEKIDTEPARKYRAFARFCNQSFNWKENRKKTAIEFKEKKEKGKERKEGEKSETKTNKEKMTFKELKELIKTGNREVIDLILGLFEVEFLEQYIDVKKREADLLKKTIVAE